MPEAPDPRDKVDITRVSKRGDDVRWAAGFLDGEGAFLILVSQDKWSKLYPRTVVRLIVYQKVRKPLDDLRALFGGRIIAKAPRPRLGINTRAGFEWILEGQGAVEACREVLPFLRVKNIPAAAIVQFGDLPWRYVKGKTKWRARTPDEAAVDYEIAQSLRRMKNVEA